MSDNEQHAREYEAAARGAAFYKRHERGAILVRGADRLDLLQRLSTNDLLGMAPGNQRFSVLTNEKGRIVDLLNVCCFESYLLILCSRNAIRTILNHFEKYVIMEDFHASDVSDEMRVYSIFGAQAEKAVENALGIPENAMPERQCFAQLGDRAFVSRGALSDGDGFTLVVSKDDSVGLEKSLEKNSAVALSTETYETLRIEGGAPEFGKELGERFNPLEAGLESAVSFTKGCYLGQEVIARLHTYHKVRRMLRKVVIPAPNVVAPPVKIYADEIECGVLTSAAFHPVKQQVIGLAYISIAAVQEAGMHVRIAGSRLPVVILNSEF